MTATRGVREQTPGTNCGAGGAGNFFFVYCLAVAASYGVIAADSRHRRLRCLGEVEFETSDGDICRLRTADRD